VKSPGSTSAPSLGILALPGNVQCPATSRPGAVRRGRMWQLFGESMNMNNQIEIYKTPDGNTEIEVQFDKDIVWLNQNQITELFLRDRTVITKHINNVFNEGELDKKAMCIFCTLPILTSLLPSIALMLLSL
jgi:hypothetical protein